MPRFPAPTSLSPTLLPARLLLLAWCGLAALAGASAPQRRAPRRGARTLALLACLPLLALGLLAATVWPSHAKDPGSVPATGETIP